MGELLIKLKDETATQRFGATLGSLLQPGDVLALIGDLGVGKTRLAQAIAAALDVPVEEVNSPTFSLIQEYRGRCLLRHCDSYRLRDPAEFADLGLDELFGMDGIAIVEWADRVLDDLPRERIEIRIIADEVTSRSMTVRGLGPRGAELLRQLSERWPIASPSKTMGE